MTSMKESHDRAIQQLKAQHIHEMLLANSKKNIKIEEPRSINSGKYTEEQYATLQTDNQSLREIIQHAKKEQQASLEEMNQLKLQIKNLNGALRSGEQEGSSPVNSVVNFVD
jgi:hypothetical protein